MKRDLRTVSDYLDTLTDVPSTVVCAMDRLTRVNRRGKAWRVVAPGKSAADRRKERKDRMAAIRETVMRREGGRCELCGGKAEHAHHVISGGLRRARESVDTVLALCTLCHRGIHAGRIPLLEMAQTYCWVAGMNEASSALARRIDKINEARRTA